MYSPLHPVQPEMSFDIYRQQPFADYNPTTAAPRAFDQVPSYKAPRRFSYADLLSGRGCDTPSLSDYEQHPDSPATTVDYDDCHPLSRRNSFVMDAMATVQDPYSYMMHSPLDICHPAVTGATMTPCDYVDCGYPDTKSLSRNGSVSSLSSTNSSRPMTPVSPSMPEIYYMQSQMMQQQQQQQQPPVKQTKSKSTRSRGRRVSNNPAAPTQPTKMFTCTHSNCGKVFKRSEHLKRHVRSIHTLEKPFVCPYDGCDKRFSRSDNLNQHIRIHRHTNKDKSSSKTFAGFMTTYL
ncbi:hypothetical protein VKS41_008525 [Umbelopsis sp. WA50703]